ncbi:MAG: serine/threonine protein kinase [Candidatus Nealsonbacteria bacterium]|nr:serine/threonine protein kinase [Candidatus Nealsonbacteria bacterium]
MDDDDQSTPTTTFLEGSATRTWGGQPAKHCSDELFSRYRSIVDRQRLSWTEHHRLLRLLGKGGQGVVYLSERRGTDSFTLPVALKIFSPEPYEDERAYDEAMARMGHVAAEVAQLQQDNLLDVHNWVDRNRIRLMEMEWVDGFDLSRLLTRKMLDRVHHRVSARRWTYINEVIVTAGPMHPRVKPGVAIAIVRDCLAALSALHRGGIVHGDLKPSNIMIKRTGDAKIVDIGSAFVLEDAPAQRTVTPTYAAPEVLEGNESSPRSDLASLGYVLIEMLSGVPTFAGLTTFRDLLEAKRFLAQRLPRILPEEVVCNELLMNFCRGLVAPDPTRRFPSAEAADLVKEGAAAFHRQLIKGDLASEYDSEIRLWLEELEDL